MTERQTGKHKGFAQRYWWLSLIRGIIALSLGTALLLEPTKSMPRLIRFMGIYWLASGLLGIIASLDILHRPGLLLAIGVVELVAGALTFLGTWVSAYADQPPLLYAFALFAVFTGVLQVVAGVRIRRRRGREWSWGSFFMGLLQIALGVLLLASDESIRPSVYHAASIWALIAGTGFILNAYRVRKHVVALGAE